MEEIVIYYATNYIQAKIVLKLTLVPGSFQVIDLIRINNLICPKNIKVLTAIIMLHQDLKNIFGKPQNQLFSL